jgi:hypothetical protein
MERNQRTEHSDWHAAHLDALRHANALLPAAATFRRYAGKLKYHPQTGVEGTLGADLLEAAEALRGHLTAITALAARWDEEITRLRAVDPRIPVDDIQRAHAGTREAASLLRAALEIFDRAVLHPELAHLDAPYGTSAPRRVHPGAQCTWVAERAEGLARAVSGVTLRKEQLLLNLSRA